MSEGDLNDALTTNPDLVAAKSLDPTSAVLGVVLRRAPQMVEAYSGRLFVSDELRTLCIEAERVPAERLVEGF